jgi:Zn finger protein HypA/HybF involved in hydrogenase expression
MAKRELIKVVCLECGKKWQVGPFADPQCPRCNGVDFDVREDSNV